MLRTSVVLSLLMQEPFHMHSIRAGRDKPGLKAQHLHVLGALRRLSGAAVRGDREGSTDVTFIPGPVKGGNIEVDVGTAGSITLLLQSLIPAASLAKAPTTMDLVGGTDVRGSMSYDFFRRVLLPHMPGANVELLRRGFYPRGGGRVRVHVDPGRPPKLELLRRPRLEKIVIASVASRELQKAEVAERQANGVRWALSSYGAEFEISIEYCDSFSTGTVVTAVAEGLGADGLGERGKPAEKVGQEAGERLAEELRTGAAVDRHAGDNFIVWLALGGGEIEVSEITEHTRTNVWVCEQFLGPALKLDGRIIRSQSCWR